MLGDRQAAEPAGAEPSRQQPSENIQPGPEREHPDQGLPGVPQQGRLLHSCRQPQQDKAHQGSAQLSLREDRGVQRPQVTKT